MSVIQLHDHSQYGDRTEQLDILISNWTKAEHLARRAGYESDLLNQRADRLSMAYKRALTRAELSMEDAE